MGVPCIHVCPCMAVPHEKPHIPSLSRLSNACRWVGSMPLGLFTMCLAWVSTCSLFRKGGQRHMGVPCTGVRPCMAVPHKKLHIGSLLHLPNGSLCTDCVPQGLLTLWVAYVNTYLLSFNRGRPMHGGSMQSCPAMHSCPPWETKNRKSVPSFKRMCVGRNMPLGLGCLPCV